MPNTYFLDLDGTIVKHNYTPDKVQDMLLPGVLEELQRAVARGDVLILTTNRSIDNCADILTKLAELGIIFQHQLFNLPAGVRVLVNDTKGDEVRAKAIPVIRNQGLWLLT